MPASALYNSIYCDSLLQTFPSKRMKHQIITVAPVCTDDACLFILSPINKLKQDELSCHSFQAERRV